MTTQIQSAFRLAPNLAAKADPALIGADERWFAAIDAELRRQTDDLTARLDTLRLAPGGHGEAALERDLEIHRLTGRLRLLRRFGLDLCLGRMVTTDAVDPVYIGRLGLTGVDGRRLLVDWRAPAAEPFFAATLARPLGLASRRRYRWTSGRIADYWDEIFDPDAELAGKVDARLDGEAHARGDNILVHRRDVTGLVVFQTNEVAQAVVEVGAIADFGNKVAGRSVNIAETDARLDQRFGGGLCLPHQRTGFRR